MQNEVANLFEALQAVLKTVTLPDGSKPFVRVKEATDLESNYLVKVPETQVLSQEDREWDNENPELGTQRLNLDCFTRDITQKSGEKQIVSDTGLNSIATAIREQASHFSGGAWGAATTLIGMSPPIREDVGNKIFRYRVRLSFETVWG
jgi:hypothetical protein